MSDFPTGESPAFRHLFETHAEALRRYARRIVHSREAAEDVVQEAFVRLWRMWNRLAIGPQTRAYLYATTRTQALNHLKHEQREEHRRMSYPRGITGDEPALPPDGEIHLDTDEIVRAIEQVFDTMPPRQREVAALRLRHQLTTREIADKLSISPRTVEVHVARATKALREQLPRLLPDVLGVPPIG